MTPTYYIKKITKNNSEQYFGYEITLSTVSLKNDNPGRDAGKITFYQSSRNQWPSLYDNDQKYVQGKSFDTFGIYQLEGETEIRWVEDWYKLTGGLYENEFVLTLETSHPIHANDLAELHKTKIIMKLEKKESRATMLEYWGKGLSEIDGVEQEVYVQTLLTEILKWVRDGFRGAQMAGLRDMPHLKLRL